MAATTMTIDCRYRWRFPLAHRAVRVAALPFRAAQTVAPVLSDRAWRRVCPLFVDICCGRQCGEDDR